MSIFNLSVVGLVLAAVLAGAAGVRAEDRAVTSTLSDGTSTTIRTAPTTTTVITRPAPKPLTLAQKRAALRKEHRNKLAALRKQWKKLKLTGKQKAAQEKKLQVELNKKLAELEKGRRN